MCDMSLEAANNISLSNPENRVCDMPLFGQLLLFSLAPVNRVCDMPPFTTPVKCF